MLDSFKRKCRNLENEVQTLKITNQRLTDMNTSVLNKHTKQIIRPALAAIATNNHSKLKKSAINIIKKLNI
eukprot:UN28594